MQEPDKFYRAFSKGFSDSFLSKKNVAFAFAAAAITFFVFAGKDEDTPQPDRPDPCNIWRIDALRAQAHGEKAPPKPPACP